MLTKQCKRCKEIKEISEFTKRKAVCKICKRIDGRNYYNNNKERASENHKKWVKNNPDKYKASCRVKRDRHDYYLENKEYILNRNKNWNKDNKDKLMSYWRKCSKLESKKEYLFFWSMRKKYNLSKEDYNCLKEEANGKCLICEKLCEKLSIDHNHETGKVRGLLCSHCNWALGHFNDSIPCLKRAIKYLEERN